jgi:DNA-binding XRE family transcriptional regulator
VSIGTNVEVLTGMHRLQKQEVAEAVAVSPQQMWNITKGKSGVSLKVARRLAKFFSVPLDTLLDGTESEVATVAAKSYDTAMAQQLLLETATIDELRELLGVTPKPKA